MTRVVIPRVSYSLDLEDAGAGILQPPLAFIFILSTRASPPFSLSTPRGLHSSLYLAAADWSPRCHFCARVPFTLSARMCDIKPQLQTFPACDPTARTGAGFYFEGEMLSPGGRKVQRYSNVTARGRDLLSFHLPGVVLIHSSAVARFALNRQPIHHHSEESFMFYLFQENSIILPAPIRQYGASLL